MRVRRASAHGPLNRLSPPPPRSAGPLRIPSTRLARGPLRGRSAALSRALPRCRRGDFDAVVPAHALTAAGGYATANLLATNLINPSGIALDGEGNIPLAVARGTFHRET